MRADLYRLASRMINAPNVTAFQCYTEQSFILLTQLKRFIQQLCITRSMNSNRAKRIKKQSGFAYMLPRLLFHAAAKHGCNYDY
jgi:hypothetical protein